MSENVIISCYSCPDCDHEWDASWDCATDEDCPVCDARNIQPFYYAEEGDFSDVERMLAFDELHEERLARARQQMPKKSVVPIACDSPNQ